jgi:hypothetical protein
MTSAKLPRMDVRMPGQQLAEASMHACAACGRTLTRSPSGWEYRVNTYRCTPPGGAGAL